MHEYHHADEVFRSSQGHSLFIGDVQAAEDTDWLRQHQVRTGKPSLVQWLQPQSGFISPTTPPLGISPTIWRTKKHKISTPISTWPAFRSTNVFHSAPRPAHQLRISTLRSRNIQSTLTLTQSPTLVIAYLIKYKAMTFLQALKFLKLKRPQVCPNLGFELQLKSYEKTHSLPSSTFLLTSKNR